MTILTNLNRILIIILTAIIVFGFTVVTLAQENTQESTIDQREVDVKPVDRLRPIVRPSDLPTREKARVQDFRTDVLQKRNEVRNEREDKRDEAVEARIENRPETNKPRTEREEVKERRAELENKKEERRAELDAKRRDRVSAYAERVLARFEAAIERLEKLSERINSRIEKLEERGLDLGNAKALLLEAKISISSAKENINEATLLIEDAIGSDDPKTAFEEVRRILNVAKESIKDTHQSLVQAVREVKASLSDRNTDEGVTENEENQPEN